MSQISEPEEIDVFLNDSRTVGVTTETWANVLGFKEKTGVRNPLVGNKYVSVIFDRSEYLRIVRLFKGFNSVAVKPFCESLVFFAGSLNRTMVYELRNVLVDGETYGGENYPEVKVSPSLLPVKFVKRGDDCIGFRIVDAKHPLVIEDDVNRCLVAPYG
ncbi:MAG: hypothetical protein QXO47_10870 [Thermoproteota archaeon]